MTVPEYDMHVHTVMCGHAHESATVERLSAHAAILKMKLLCFAEHVHCQATLEELKQLREQIDAVQPVCSCKLILGAEIDCDRRRHDGTLVVERPDWLEFVIGSIHYQWDDNDVSGDAIDIWENTMLGLSGNRKVDVIGHPGAYILNEESWWRHKRRILGVFTQAAHNSAAIKQAWDLNNLTLSKLDKREKEKYWKIIEIAYHKGVPLYYGSDTHHIASLGRTQNILKIIDKIRGLEPEMVLKLPEALAKKFNIPID